MIDINIDEIINSINQNNKLKGEKCMVCHMKDSNKNLIKLDCKHFFHNDCIQKKNNTITCLYCNKKTKLKKKITKTNDKNICKVILKSGKNKGKSCGRTNCHYHK